MAKHWDTGLDVRPDEDVDEDDPEWNDDKPAGTLVFRNTSAVCQSGIFRVFFWCLAHCFLYQVGAVDSS